MDNGKKVTPVPSANNIDVNTNVNGNGNGLLLRLGRLAAAIFGIGLLLYVVADAVFITKDRVNIMFESEKEKRQALELKMVVELGNIAKVLGEIKKDQGYLRTEMDKQSKDLVEIRKDQQALTRSVIPR